MVEAMRKAEQGRDVVDETIMSIQRTVSEHEKGLIDEVGAGSKIQETLRQQAISPDQPRIHVDGIKNHGAFDYYPGIDELFFHAAVRPATHSIVPNLLWQYREQIIEALAKSH